MRSPSFCLPARGRSRYKRRCSIWAPTAGHKCSSRQLADQFGHVKGDGEIAVTWRRLEALSRAQRLLEMLTRPLAPASRFVQLTRPGETIIVNNRHVVHGRTPYIDPVTGPGRVLARKWFVPSERGRGATVTPPQWNRPPLRSVLSRTVLG